jgi:hypothetical protein
MVCVLYPILPSSSRKTITIGVLIHLDIANQALLTLEILALKQALGALFDKAKEYLSHDVEET